MQNYTMKQAAELLMPLQKYVQSKPPYLPGWDGLLAVQGRRGPANFIITIDHDGHVEASLSQTRNRKPKTPTPSVVAKFFEAWGVEPFDVTLNRHIFHAVVRPANTQ